MSLTKCSTIEEWQVEFAVFEAAVWRLAGRPAELDRKVTTELDAGNNQLLVTASSCGYCFTTALPAGAFRQSMN